MTGLSHSAPSYMEVGQFLTGLYSSTTTANNHDEPVEACMQSLFGTREVHSRYAQRVHLRTWAALCLGLGTTITMAYGTRQWQSWAIGVMCLFPLGLAQPKQTSPSKNIYSPSTFTFSRPLPPRHTPGKIIAGFHISFDESESGSESDTLPSSIVCPTNVFLNIQTDLEFNYLTRQQYETRGRNLRDFCFHLGCFCDKADRYTVNCPDPESPDEIRYPMLDHCEESCHCLSEACCSDSD